MGAWVIGHNTAGYLPESDTYAFELYADAYDSFVEMAREYASENDEQNDATADETWAEDDYGTMRACVDSILADEDHRATDGLTCGMVVADSDDRRISFWLVWSDDRQPDEEDD